MDDKDHLKKQMDLLWNKIQEQGSAAAVPEPWKEEAGLSSAFDAAQKELQAESVNLLRNRFEKEKTYWENLLAAKEEALANLKKNADEERQKNAQLRAKIQEMQDGQGQIFQQTLGTLDLQKRALGAHMDKLERELESSRAEIVSLHAAMQEERSLLEQAQREWQEKEVHWLEDLKAKEEEVHRIREEEILERQKAEDQIARLGTDLDRIKARLSEDQKIHETERQGLQQLLEEKEAQIGKIQQDLAQFRTQLEKEREERRLAVVERERQNLQRKEEDRRMIDQLLLRENKIKELQDALDRAAAERQALIKREENIVSQEENLARRREDWVDSIRGQASQQLSISGKIVDILNKIDSGGTGLQVRPMPKPPSTPPPLPADRTAPQESSASPRRPGVLKESFAALLRSLASSFDFLGTRKGWALMVSGFLLFAVSTGLLFYERQSVRSMRAQKYLQMGNEQFTQGALIPSFHSLEKAYALDPENEIIRNSLILVLGEVAHKNFREGNLEAALAQTETLNKLVPEDPDVLQLRNDVLHELGRREKAAAAAAPAVEDSKKESQPEKDSAPARTPSEDELIPTDSAIDPDKPAQP
jgi:hypothetical protein